MNSAYYFINIHDVIAKYTENDLITLVLIIILTVMIMKCVFV